MQGGYLAGRVPGYPCTDLRRLYYRNRLASTFQGQRCSQPRNATADHRDVNIDVGVERGITSGPSGGNPKGNDLRLQLIAHNNAFRRTHRTVPISVLSRDTAWQATRLSR